MSTPLKPIQQRQNVRENIIEQASTLFHQRGIRNVTMDDIAHAMTMSKRTLYQIFTDKEQLLLACVENHEHEMQQTLEQIFHNTDNVLSFLLRVFGCKMKELDEVQSAFYADIHKFPKVVAHIKAHQKAQEDESVKFLNKGIEQGMFRSDVNFRIVARQLAANFDSVVRNGLVDEYSQREIFVNTVIPYIRGCATLKGIEMIDAFLDAEMNE